MPPSNPGSPEAVAQGCTCPVMDNDHGKGFVYFGVLAFWYTEGCPVHTQKEDEDNA